MSFWDNKLNGVKSSVVIPPTDMFGMYKPVNTPEPTSGYNSIPGPGGYRPSVPMTAGAHCPRCGTDNYRTFGSYAITCTECGYHPRFIQEGSGIRVPREAGVTATPTKQLDYMGTNLRGQIAQMNANQHVNIPNQ